MTTTTSLQEGQLRSNFDDLVRRGAFNPNNRFLTRMHDAEDRAAEGIAQTWAIYRSCAERGKLLPPGALVTSARRRACDLSRRLVSDGTRAKNSDALSQLAYQRGDVQTLRLDGIEGDGDHVGASSLEDGLARELCANPERKLNSALDLQGWLGTLSDDERCMLAARMAGEGLKEIAAGAGISTPTACRRLHELSYELAERAGIELGARQGQRAS